MPGAEYLIRPSSHDGWLVIRADALAKVLVPRGYRVEEGTGSGELHLHGAGQVQENTGTSTEWVRVT